MKDDELKPAEKKPPLTDEELLALCDKASPAPWSACHDGECPCKQVWTAEHPIAKIEAGEWGDEYPALRVKDNPGPHGTSITIEAFVDGMPYGSVDEAAAQANAQLIAAAREAIPRLIQEKRKAEAQRDALKRLALRDWADFEDEAELDIAIMEEIEAEKTTGTIPLSALQSPAF